MCEQEITSEDQSLYGRMRLLLNNVIELCIDPEHLEITKSSVAQLVDRPEVVGNEEIRLIMTGYIALKLLERAFLSYGDPQKINVEDQTFPRHATLAIALSYMIKNECLTPFVNARKKYRERHSQYAAMLSEEVGGRQVIEALLTPWDMLSTVLDCYFLYIFHLGWTANLIIAGDNLETLLRLFLKLRFMEEIDLEVGSTRRICERLGAADFNITEASEVFLEALGLLGVNGQSLQNRVNSILDDDFFY